MKKVWQVTLLLIGFSGFAAAAQLCTEVATTAQAFQSLGLTGCQFGDKIFYNFTYTYTLEDANGDTYGGDPNNPVVTASEVTVSFSDLNSNPYEPVVSFTSSPSWMVSGGVAGDIRINYDVSAPSPHNAYLATLSADGSLTNVDPENQFAPYISIAEGLLVNGQAGVVNLGLELDPPLTTTLTPFATSQSDLPVFFEQQHPGRQQRCVPQFRNRRQRGNPDPDQSGAVRSRCCPRTVERLSARRRTRASRVSGAVESERQTTMSKNIWNRADGAALPRCHGRFCGSLMHQRNRGQLRGSG